MLIELSLSGKKFVFSLGQLTGNLSFNIIHMLALAVIDTYLCVSPMGQGGG